MHNWLSISHFVFISKYRRKALYGRLCRQVGAILRDLRVPKDIGLLEGHAMLNHVHMPISIPPKYSVAFTVGVVEGQERVRILRELLKERRVTRLQFWVQGYCVSTIGLEEQRKCEYVRNQERQSRLADGQSEIWGFPKVPPSGHPDYQRLLPLEAHSSSSRSGTEPTRIS